MLPGIRSLLEKTYADVDNPNEKFAGKYEKFAETIEDHAGDRFSVPDPIAFGAGDRSRLPGVIDAAPETKSAVAGTIAVHAPIQSAIAGVIDAALSAGDPPPNTIERAVAIPRWRDERFMAMGC